MYSFQRQLWSDCISEFTKLIHVDPENSQALLYRGRSYAALSFYSEAMQDLTQAIRLSPNTAVYYFHRGCLLREQHIVKAIQDFSISILLDNSAENCDAYFYRGICVLYLTK
jgi:tetratricopeptide (TPR) repeat protein